jgi:putative ubiquitin-RnfH superfamily antitoxin RatB of RatAB toxin-antitoxin module
MPDGTLVEESDLRVSVVYAGETTVDRATLLLPRNSTVKDAVERSGVLQQQPQLSLSSLLLGIYGRRVTLDTMLQNDDRVEIYRTLIIDPKEARRRKAHRHGLRAPSSSDRRSKR